MERVREAGIKVIRYMVDVSNGLEGVVQDVKRIATESNYAVQDSDVYCVGKLHWSRSKAFCWG